MLTQTYLWDQVSQYGRSSDGYTRLHQDRVWAAAEKLEMLISETVARRRFRCDHPDDDILEEDKLKVILDDWTNNYQQWMRPETLDRTWAMTNMASSFTQSFSIPSLSNCLIVRNGCLLRRCAFQQRKPPGLSLLRRPGCLGTDA